MISPPRCVCGRAAQRITMTKHAPFEPGHRATSRATAARAASALARRRAYRPSSSCSITRKAAKTRIARRSRVGDFLSEIVSRKHSPPLAHVHGIAVRIRSRAVVWRVFAAVPRAPAALTVFGVGMALARNPAVVDAFVEDGHEIASHGWRWISYQQIDEHIEREHMRLAIDTITRLTGRRRMAGTLGDSPIRAGSSSSKRIHVLRRRLGGPALLRAADARLA